jgi:hypothetical protein
MGTLTSLLLAAGLATALVAADDIQKPISTKPTAASKGTPATIQLYPGSRIHPEDLKHRREELQSCPADSETSEVELHLDTCLSGEYYPQSNFKFTDIPSCPDGSAPKASFFPRRKCKGSATFTTEVELRTCLWSKEHIPNPPYYWSMILHCGQAPVDGVLGHQVANPPTIVHQIDGGATGELSTYTISQCHAMKLRDAMSSHSATDSCWWPVDYQYPFHSVKVTRPSICPNGTRARLALFEDTHEGDRRYNCNGGEITFEDGLLDINDDDVGKCINVRDLALSRGGVANTKAVTFYCDGLDLSKEWSHLDDQTEKAVVSHNECRPLNSGEEPPPITFMDLAVGECANIPKGQPLRLRKAPTCPPGESLLVATWPAYNCNGLPTEVFGKSASIGSICEYFSDDGDSSYALWCGKDGKDDWDGRAIYSTRACPARNGFRSIEEDAGLSPSIKRIEPDKCIPVLSEDSDWMLHRGAKCPNGKKARLAFWNKESKCRGKPTSIKRVDEKSFGKCVEACPKSGRWREDCSAAFWCKGFKS